MCINPYLDAPLRTIGTGASQQSGTYCYAVLALLSAGKMNCDQDLYTEEGK